MIEEKIKQVEKDIQLLQEEKARLEEERDKPKMFDFCGLRITPIDQMLQMHVIPGSGDMWGGHRGHRTSKRSLLDMIDALTKFANSL